MNYEYNIKVNLKKELINFYEWNKNDKITILKKVPVFKVNDDTYSEFLNFNIKVNKKFIEKIELSNNICIFCTDIDSICIKFNIDGEIDKISKLDLLEEKDILDSMIGKSKYKLNYKKLSSKKIYSYNTREENKIINTLVEYLELKKDNKEIIDYLYYEWFNKNSNNKNKYEKLVESIKNEYNIKHQKLYEIIELINS